MKTDKKLHSIISMAFILLFLGLMSATVTHAETYTFVTKWGSEGSADGYFSFTSDIAVDSSGNVYVLDYGNSCIQKFSSSGTFLTKWGSEGSGDGQFIFPTGIAVDSSGNIYVTDFNNNCIQKFSSSGTFLTKWGSEGSEDGQFYHPVDVAVDSPGNVYVADRDNHRIKKFSSNGTFLTKWGSSENGDNQLYSSSGIVVDSSGNVYVVDEIRNSVKKFSSNGTFLTKWGSYGSGDGQFNQPSDIAVDSSGNVYVTDRINARIQKFSSDGIFLTKWGSYGSGDGQFMNPIGAAVDSLGNVYVADDFNYRIQKFSKEKTTPAITWSNPADIVVGTALSSIQLNAIAIDPNTRNSVTGTFTYNPQEDTVLEVGTHILHVNFTPSDSATYNTAAADVQINILPVPLKTPTITWDNPADIIYETALGSTQLSASASVLGTFTYIPPAGTILGAGTHTLHVDFTPTDSANYNTVSKDATINVLKATPTITWDNPSDIIAGTLLTDTQLNAAASVPGTFVYTPPAGTMLNIGTQTLHVDFTPTDSVNYNTASTDVKINVLEKPAVPVADFSASPTTGKAPLTVTFTDSSTGSPTSWSWNFGDKSISTDRTPVHTYNKAGKYTVSLTVKNELGSNTRKTSNYIVVKK